MTSLVFASLACNRTSNCIAWRPDVGDGAQCFAYGGQNVVAVADAERLLGRAETDLFLSSGAADGTVVIRREAEPLKFEECAAIKVSAGAVTALASVSGAADSRPLLLACTADGQLHTLLQREDGAWSLVSSIDSGPARGFNAVATAALPGGGLVAALAGLDNAVHLHVLDPASEGEGGDSRPLRWRHAAALPGHSDWVRALAFRELAPGEEWLPSDGPPELLLASAAQDGRVRVWRIAVRGSAAAAGGGEEEVDGTLEGAAAPAEDAMRCLRGPDGRRFDVTLETVLLGHEEWATGACWLPRGAGQRLALATCGIDRIVLVWSPEAHRGGAGAGAEQGLWAPVARLGGVAGRGAGFFGLALGGGGRHIVAHSFSGGLYAWRLAGPAAVGEEGAAAAWRPVAAAAGVAGPVSDVAWDPRGRYLCAAGADMTARVYAPARGRWCELARPITHGYALSSLCPVPARTGGAVPDHTVVCAADEKALRVFAATSVFVQGLEAVAGEPSDCDDPAVAARPAAAAVPELGLTSRAYSAEQIRGLGEGAAAPDEEAAVALAAAEPLLAPPLEGRLAVGTLWPEVDRLYGHGHPALAVAANPEGTLVATACRARDAAHAGIRLWDTSSWRQCAELGGHTNSVVQLQFSHRGDRLLSVSRDRHVCVFQVDAAALLREARGAGPGSAAGPRALEVVRRGPSARAAKAHRRIVWSGSWSHDDLLIATGSRDASVRLWRCAEAPAQGEGAGAPPALQLVPAGVTTFGGAVTAVAFAPRAHGGAACARYVLAVGLESGRASLWALDLVAPEGNPHARAVRWTELGPVCDFAGPVKRLAWRPRAGELLLAGCGSDGTVRIHSVPERWLVPAEDARPPEPAS